MAHVSKNITKFYSKLDVFRKLEKHTDITIVCEQTSFHCHRIALALACPYFDSMFSVPLREKNAESVVLPNTKSVTFQEVLRFIYTGDAIINSDNFFDLLVVSDFLGLSDLETLCNQYLERGLAFKNILDVLSFAEATNKPILVNVLVNHVTKYLKLCLRCEEFLDIPFWFLSRVLTNPKFSLSLVGKKVLENAISRWINHSRTERSHYFIQFLGLLNGGEYGSFITLELENPSDCVKVSDNCEVNDYQSLVSKNRKALNVFVSYRTRYEPNQSLSEDWVQVFEMDENFECFATSKIAQDSNVVVLHTMRHVAINNTYLYCLNYYPGHRAKFSVSTSIEGQSERILKCPPNVSHLFDICEMNDSILVYEKIKGSIYWYNKELDEWFPVPSMNDAEKKYASVTCCSHTHLLYLIGGGNGRNSCTNSVQAYDYRTGNWQTLPAAIIERSSAASCVYKNKIYVSGGVMMGFLEVYDPATRRWEGLKQMTKKLSNARMVPYENALWIVDGFDIAQSSIVNQYIDKYDPILNEWYTYFLPTRDQNIADRFFKVLDAVVFRPG